MGIDDVEYTDEVVVSKESIHIDTGRNKENGGKDNLNNPNEKVLIIDGLNTFIRVFSVIPTTNDDGIHVGGIVGFLKSVGYKLRLVTYPHALSF